MEFSSFLDRFSMFQWVSAPGGNSRFLSSVFYLSFAFISSSWTGGTLRSLSLIANRGHPIRRLSDVVVEVEPELREGREDKVKHTFQHRPASRTLFFLLRQMPSNKSSSRRRRGARVGPAASGPLVFLSPAHQESFRGSVVFHRDPLFFSADPHTN